jgi:hypothetical protein
VTSAITASIVFSLSVSVGLSADNVLTFPNQKIDTPVGAVFAMGLEVKGSLVRNTRLTGTLQNATSKRWGSMRIRITPSDGKGTQFNSSTVAFYALPSGGSSSFYFDLTGKFDFQTLQYRFEYESGTYPASYHFEMVKPKSGPLEFADDLTEWKFTPQSKGIGFELVNKSDKVLKLDWNSATFVDGGGKTHKVAGSGVRYMEVNAVKAPSVVPPGARVEDLFFPTDNVTFSGSWIVTALFPECPLCKEWEGKLFSLFIPLESGGSVKEYLFQFKAVSVE